MSLFNYLCLKYSKLLVYMDSLFLTMQKTEVLKTRKKRKRVKGEYLYQMSNYDKWKIRCLNADASFILAQDILFIVFA